MFEQITQLPNLLIITGLFLIMLELFIGIEAGFDLVVLGSILIIGGASGYIFQNHLYTLILCSILVVVYIAFARAIIKQKLVIKTKQTNVDKLIGKTGLVTKDITPDKSGSVKIDDEEWRASSSETIKINEKATVETIEGVTLTVKKY